MTRPRKPRYAVSTPRFRTTPFNLFWCSRVSSTLALHMQAVAVGWQLYALTGSALDLGLVGLVQFVPIIVLTLVAGQAADRYDRRRVVVACHVAEAGGATALLPIYARDILGTGPWGLGLLRAAAATGALATSLVLARRPVDRGAGRLLFGGVFAFGVTTVVFGVSTSLPLSLAALAALGASDLLSVVIRHSLVQLRTPDAMRGRVSAVHSLFTGTSNQLGEFESGVLAALFGAVPAVLIGGVGTIVVAAVYMRRFPELRRFHLA